MMTMNFWNYAGMGGRGVYEGWMGGWLSMMLLPLVVWSLFWKGWALWKAARKGATAWFVVLLILNTAGILEIIYIFLVAREPVKTLKKKRK